MPPIRLRTQQTQARSAVDGDGVAGPGERADRRRPAPQVQELAGRIDLERPHRQHQGRAAFLRGAIGQPVARHQARAAGLAHGEGGDAQLPVVAAPGDRGHRQATVGQGLLRGDVGPGQQLPVHLQERFDAELAGAGLQRAVAAEQPFLGIAVQAHHRPVDLLVQQAPGKHAAPGVGGHGGEEGLAAGRERQGLDRHLAQRGRRPGRAPPQPQPQIAGLRLGQEEVIAVAAPADGRPQQRPALPVQRSLQRVVGRPPLGLPVENQAAELAARAQVQLQGRGRIVGRRFPPGRRIAVHRRGRLMPRDEGRRPRQRRRRRPGRHRQRHQLEVVDPHGAAAAAAGGDGELDGRDPAQLAAPLRPPGEGDLPLAEGDRLPRVRPGHVPLHVPPDVLAAAVDQLEFQVVDRRLAPQPESEGVVLRQGEIHFAADDGVATAGEGEVQAQGAALGPEFASHVEPDPVGRMGRPGQVILEVVDDDDRVAAVRAAERQQQRHDHPASVPTIHAPYPFTLPLMMPLT